MKTRIDETIVKHDKGYNCAQAVACTYCDLVDCDENEIFKMLEGFGLGMGNMDGTCGAISGAITLAGMKNSNGIEGPLSKAGTYKIAKEIIERFGEMNGSVICREIKGTDTGEVLRSCPDCIKDAAQIVEEVLFR